MLEGKSKIGGALMAAMLLMGAVNEASFGEMAGDVTITPEMLSRRTVSCRLFVNGKEQTAAPGRYTHALLLARERRKEQKLKSRVGEVDQREESAMGIYVDAKAQG